MDHGWVGEVCLVGPSHDFVIGFFLPQVIFRFISVANEMHTCKIDHDNTILQIKSTDSISNSRPRAKHIPSSLIFYIFSVGALKCIELSLAGITEVFSFVSEEQY